MLNDKMRFSIQITNLANEIETAWHINSAQKHIPLEKTRKILYKRKLIIMISMKG